MTAVKDQATATVNMHKNRWSLAMCFWDILTDRQTDRCTHQSWQIFTPLLGVKLPVTAVDNMYINVVELWDVFVTTSLHLNDLFPFPPTPSVENDFSMLWLTQSTTGRWWNLTALLSKLSWWMSYIGAGVLYRSSWTNLVQATNAAMF